MKLTIRGVNTILIEAFVFVCALMPAESYNTKEIFLGLLLVLNAGTIVKGLFKYRYLLPCALLLPIWMLLISILAGGKVGDSIRGVYVFTLLWIPIIAVRYDIDLNKIFINMMYCIAIIIDLFVLFHASGVMPLQSNPVATWLTETGNAQLSYGDVAIFYYVFFLNGSPLIFFALIDALQRGSKIRVLIVFMALLFSGTRANIYLSFMATVAYLVMYRRNDWKKILLIAVGVILTIIVIVKLMPVIMKKINTINAVKTHGDSVRENRTTAAIGTIFGDYKVFLIGMGANVPFRANGIQNFSSEMSYIEIWRNYGIFSLVGVLSMLLFVLWRIRRNAIIIAYVAYLVICAVDPFLMTSTGFLMLMYMFYMVIFADKCAKSIRFVCKPDSAMRPICQGKA